MHSDTELDALAYGIITTATADTWAGAVMAGVGAIAEHAHHADDLATQIENAEAFDDARKLVNKQAVAISELHGMRMAVAAIVRESLFNGADGREDDWHGGNSMGVVERLVAHALKED